MSAAILLLLAAVFVMPVAAESPVVTIQNSYPDVTIERAIITEERGTGFIIAGNVVREITNSPTMQILVSYTGDNAKVAMAGMTVTYTLDGEPESAIPVALAYKAGDAERAKWASFTDEEWTSGQVIANCTSYVATIPDGATDVTLTVDGLTFWSYDETNKKLSITGSGNMPAFSTTSSVTVTDTKYSGHPDATGDKVGKGSRYASFPWHKYQLEIESVEFDNAITSIGGQAFRKHVAVESITFPTSLKMVMNYGVGDCSALAEADLSACTDLSSVWKNSFSGMANPSTITVANAEIYSLFNSANCISSSTNVEYPGMDKFTSGVWEVHGNTVDGTCTIVGYSGTDSVNVDIPATFEHESKTYVVKELAQYLFYNNKQIQTVTFAEGSQCEKIGKYAFAGADMNNPSSFTSITLPDTITDIGGHAFYCCKNLKSLPNIPGNLETIGEYAFHTYASGSATTSITIPATVTYMGDNAFRQCAKVKHVTILSPEITLGKAVFSYANYQSINLTAVKKITLAEGPVFDMNKGDSVSSIYVADAAMAEKIYSHIRYEIDGKDGESEKGTLQENCRPACVIVTDGGVVAESPNGLASVRKEGYTPKWFIDASFTTPVTDTNLLESKKTYYVQWTKEVSGSGVTYTVNAISDQVYNATAITPDIIIKDSEGKPVEYRIVEWKDNTKVGQASVKVQTIPDDIEIDLSFNIVKDRNPVVLMAEKSITFGTDYEMSPEAKTSGGNAIDVTPTLEYFSDRTFNTPLAEKPTDAGTYWARATLAETDNYTSAYKVAKIEIIKATFQIAAEGYSGVYDGKQHSISITAPLDATIEYSEDGITYSTVNPVYTNAGSYPVYYNVTKENHNSVKGSVTVNIEKAQPVLTITPDSSTLVGGGQVTFTLKGVPDGETVIVSCDGTIISSTDGIYTVELLNKEKIYTITVEHAETTNYKYAKATNTVTVTEIPVTIVNKPEGSTVETDEPVSAEDKGKLITAMEGDFKTQFSGKPRIFVEISLIDSTGNPDSTTPITFIIGYDAFGIDQNKYGNYNFVVLHLKGTTFEIVPATPTADGLVITSTCSPFAISYSVKEQPSSGSTPQGSSVWLTESATPTPTETVTPTETIPTSQPTSTQTEPTSPLSVLGVLAGLGAVAVLRRK